MKFSSFFAKQLPAAWIFSAPHTLWRVVFSTNGKIVCESRNTDAKIVTFTGLTEGSGSTLWQDKSYGEAWWTGIEGIADDRLFLHGFRKPDMPDHLGIICIDMVTGNEQWRNMNCTFSAVHKGAIFGYKDLFERRVYYRLDSLNGAITEELDALPDDVEENMQMEKTDFSFPRPKESFGEELVQFIRSAEDVNPADHTGVECIETAQYLLLSRYTANANPEEGLKNTLSVIDRTTKKKIYTDVLNRSTPYPVPDSFFMEGRRVYYIKERKQLVAVDLPQ